MVGVISRCNTRLAPKFCFMRYSQRFAARANGRSGVLVVTSPNFSILSGTGFTGFLSAMKGSATDKMSIATIQPTSRRFQNLLFLLHIHRRSTTGLLNADNDLIITDPTPTRQQPFGCRHVPFKGICISINLTFIFSIDFSLLSSDSND